MIAANQYMSPKTSPLTLPSPPSPARAAATTRAAHTIRLNPFAHSFCWKTEPLCHSCRGKDACRA